MMKVYFNTAMISFTTPIIHHVPKQSRALGTLIKSDWGSQIIKIVGCYFTASCYKNLEGLAFHQWDFLQGGQPRRIYLHIYIIKVENALSVV